jgi:hypothetical protein
VFNHPDAPLYAVTGPLTISLAHRTISGSVDPVIVWPLAFVGCYGMTDIWLQKQYVFSTEPVDDNVQLNVTQAININYKQQTPVAHHWQSADGTYPNATVGDSTYAP